MQIMFFARHFACSVICALGRRVSVQKAKLLRFQMPFGELCEPRASMYMRVENEKEDHKTLIMPTG